MDHDRSGSVQFVYPLGELAEGNERRTRDAVDLVLLLLAHVENEDVFFPVQFRFQLLGHDLHLTRVLRLMCTKSTELLVVNQFPDRGMFSADRAVWIFSHLHLTKLHPQGIKDEQSTDQRIAGSHDQLDRLSGLNGSNDSGKNSEDSAFCATRNQAGRRRLGIKAAIARPALGGEDRSLSVEAKDAAVDIRLAEKHTGVVDQVTSRKVVGSVDDDVVVGKNVEGIL